jgi:hypothetical protein
MCYHAGSAACPYIGTCPNIAVASAQVQKKITRSGMCDSQKIHLISMVAQHFLMPSGNQID